MSAAVTTADGDAASSSSKEKVCVVMAGSFSPLTNLHLRCFERARDLIAEEHPELEVAKGAISPVNDFYPKKGLLSSTHRLAMARRGVRRSTWIDVHDWEAKRTEYQPTAGVLRHIEDDLHMRTVFLCGADLLATFVDPGVWEEDDIEQILGHHGMVCIERNSVSDLAEFINKHEILSKHRKNIWIAKEYVQNDISATVVRDCLAKGRSVRYLCPDDVVDYIEEYGLFK